MNPYSRFAIVSTAVYFLIVGISFTFIRSAITAHFGAAGSTTSGTWQVLFDLALFALVALAAYVFVEHFLSPNLATFAWFRRFILQSHYIEGTWIEDIVSPHGRRGLSILTIAPLGYSISISGSNYYYSWNEETQTIEDLAPAGTSRSTLVNISWPTVLYTYLNHKRPRGRAAARETRPRPRNIVIRPTNQEDELLPPYDDPNFEVEIIGKNEGMGEMQFERVPGKAPQRFDGYFHHVGQPMAHSFSGYRCTDQEAELISRHSDRIALIKVKIEMLRSSRVYFRRANSENTHHD